VSACRRGEGVEGVEGVGVPSPKHRARGKGRKCAEGVKSSWRAEVIASRWYSTEICACNEGEQQTYNVRNLNATDGSVVSF